MKCFKIMETNRQRKERKRKKPTDARKKKSVRQGCIKMSENFENHGADCEACVVHAGGGGGNKDGGGLH